MIEILDGSTANLAKVESNVISKPTKPISIGELELTLLKRWPREDAEPWDRMGLIVGDPAALVTGVAVALDVTSNAISAAAQAGANVLLTHHPVFLEGPVSFSPSYAVSTAPGVNVYKAISSGVALMNFHTALDVSHEATRLLPSMLKLDFERLIVAGASGIDKGYGQLCRVRPSDAPFKLGQLAARCTSVFGRLPRVWGNDSRTLSRIVIANGSASSVVAAAIAVDADCLVCGELGYHPSIDASQAGLCIIELGHDVSELPLTALLAQSVIDAGVPTENVSILDQSGNWHVPESTRI